jgi:phosphoribosylformylglycinamidine cyclo-ligase
MKRYDTVGADIVNHCVNDVAVCGAVPLAFLDYYAVGKLRAGAFSEIIRGLAKACRQNNVALIGGETAELPDVYGPGKYDIAGTIIGVVGRGEILDGRKTRAGDVLVGLPSTGLHTNGYTLARAAFFKRKRYSPSSRLPGLRKTLGEELLRVHRSYLAPIRALHKASLLRAAAHITGGGIAGNLIRVIPKPLGAVVGKSSWNVPPLFRRLQEAGGVSDREMFRATNMGIGIVFVVPHRRLDSVLTLLRKMKERPVVMGEVLRGEHEVALE